MTDSPVQWREALASTQDEAHGLAAAGAAHGTGVAARVQSAGRGTRGREWVSEEGGLWLSVVCRPDAGAATEVIGLRVGLALAEFLDTIIGPSHRVAIKWPNDLYLLQRKLGGILVEARWHGDSLGWMVVGVGLNVRNEIPSSFTKTAVSLAGCGFTADPVELAVPVTLAVAKAARAALPLTAAELRAFEERDWLRGRAIALPTPGVAEGISSTGRLLVRTLAGIVTEVTGPIRLDSEA
jgi:BirA family biotin operon repressor/biotin-[acetyl-CoA-carboxylase] ligase